MKMIISVIFAILLGTMGCTSTQKKSPDQPEHYFDRHDRPMGRFGID